MNSADKGAVWSMANASKWWLSATPFEARLAGEVVDRFIRSIGPASVEEVEAFARALALAQLLDDKDALMQAAETACSVLQAIRRHSEDTVQLAAAADWYETRGIAIEVGLVRARELAGLEGGPSKSAIEQFSLYLALYRDASTREHLIAMLRRNKLEGLVKKRLKL